MVAVPFELRRPASLAEAVDELADGGVPYCGGTELLAVMQLGLVAPDVLVDLKRVPELAGIIHDGDHLVIGARATHAEVAGSPLVARSAAVLVEASTRLGNVRVRGTGTPAGNLCFAEPRSDVATALFALDAAVDLRGPDGTRTLPVTDFVVGGFTTALADDELLTAIRLPAAPATGIYLRFQPAEYPTATVAMVRPGGSAAWRLVVGAVGERPHVCRYRTLDLVDPAVVAAELDVVPDRSGAEDYKRQLAEVLITRAVEQLRRDGDGT